MSTDHDAERADTHTPPDPSVTPEEQLTHDLSLILMYLSSWTERRGEAPRFWKGFRFEILNQLDDEGLIQDSRGAKSAYLTDAGVKRARELLAQYRFDMGDERGGLPNN